MNFRKYISVFTMIILSSMQAQKKEFIKWEILVPKAINSNEEVELVFKVKLKSLCFIHSTNIKGRNGKNTSIWFRENGEFKITEQLEAIYEIEYYNRNTYQMAYIIEEEGGFAQKIKVLKPNPIIKGQINYVLCNRGSNQEIPQVYHFEIQLKTKNN